jgi:hypothetical protein
LLFVAILWQGGFPYVGMMYYRFECVLGRCVLGDIMFVWLGSVNMLLFLVEGGVGLLHILPRCGW